MRATVSQLLGFETVAMLFSRSGGKRDGGLRRTELVAGILLYLRLYGGRLEIERFPLCSHQREMAYQHIHPLGPAVHQNLDSTD